MTERVSIAACQRKLATLWSVAALLILIAILLQSHGHLYVRTDGNAEYDRTADVWQWFTPLVMPTLSLMIGTVVAESQRPSTTTVPTFIYRLSLGCRSSIWHWC